VNGLTPSRFGYSDAYRVLMLGSTGSSERDTISFGYDPRNNTNSGFTGNGSEVLFRNGMRFKTPNSADSAFIDRMQFVSGNSSVNFPGNVGIGTTNPGAELEVAGSIERNDGLSGSKSFEFSVGGSSVTGNLLSATADTNDDAVFVHVRIYGTRNANNGAEVWDGYALARDVGQYPAPGAIDTFKTYTGTMTDPTLVWSGSGNTRDLVLRMTQTFSRYHVVVNVVRYSASSTFY